MGRFTGKHAVITGGRRGIGLAFAKALLEQGADVTVISKSKDPGELPTKINYISADLSIDKEVHGLLWGTCFPDILINNAAIAHNYTAMDYPKNEWKRILQVNLTAPFDLSCRAVEEGCKRIIMMSSISGLNSARKVSGYTATKHAIIGLTKALSNEWAPKGVTVNAIVPGYIETDMLKLQDPKTIIGRIPVGRLGTPADLVPLMLLLCSDEAEYMTGGVYPVDGGWLAR
jgi:2-deoxy-D-gluconate 3-dehydrogenase